MVCFWSALSLKHKHKPRIEPPQRRFDFVQRLVIERLTERSTELSPKS